MEDAEAERLRELGRELAGALKSPWQPLAIAQAFASRGAGELQLTMQGWIDLEAARSPLLVQGKLETPEQIAAAFRAFDLDFDLAATIEARPGFQTPPDDAVLIIGVMRRVIAEAFAASLPMTPPGPAGEDADPFDGFGDWAPIFACLVAQCGITPAIALRLPVEQAFVLIAAHRHNQGWRTAGVPYALREAEDKETRGQGDN